MSHVYAVSSGVVEGPTLNCSIVYVGAVATLGSFRWQFISFCLKFSFIWFVFYFVSYLYLL